MVAKQFFRRSNGKNYKIQNSSTKIEKCRYNFKYKYKTRHWISKM